MPAIHHVEEHKNEDLIAVAKRLEQSHYRFHVTPREWRVSLRDGTVLMVDTKIPDGEDGGLSDREFRRLAHENMREAVTWAMKDLQQRIRMHEQKQRIKSKLR